MPNGGPDCCGNCSYNQAVQQMAHPHPEQVNKFQRLSRCTLRDVAIRNAFWTYCDHFEYGKRPETRDLEVEPVGFITSSGLYEGYVRIPWDDLNEPRVAVPATCMTCKRETEQGIEISHDNTTLGFCTNRHYVEWWKTLHQDDSFKPERLQTPEQRYKRR